MANYGPAFPSGPGLSRPPVVPIKGAIPSPTCWHLTIFEVSARDEDGYVFDTLANPDRVLERLRGRIKTLKMHGYHVERIAAGNYMCSKEKEVLLVAAVSCYCRAKTVEDLADMGRSVEHYPRLPSREETLP